jgi:hypothetical protein
MKSIFAVALFFISVRSFASVDLGVGISSFTSGRAIPSINGSIKFTDWTISAFTTGAATPLYSHSGYYLGMTHNFISGKLFGQDVNSSLGFGSFFAKRHYKATEAAPLENRDDFAVGPAFKIKWQFLEHAYMGFDYLMGIRPSMALIAFATQDVVGFSLGVSL